MALDTAVWPIEQFDPRPYQVEAYERMVDRGNQLLALVMGAGKTVVAQAAIETLHRQGHVRNGLVFVPNTLKYQWLESLRAIGAPAQVIDGPREQKIYQYKWMKRFRYNIVNYEALLGDLDMIHTFLRPDFIISDETTYIKGMTAKRSKRLKTLGNSVDIRFALTGQPIENRPEELFSIMEFVDPTVLGTPEKFDRTFILRTGYGKASRYRNFDTLKRAMAPVMFRKTRKDIEEWLPQIIPVEAWVDLRGPARDLYEFMAEDTLRVIDEAIAAGAMGGWDVLALYGRSDNSNVGSQIMGEIASRVTCMRMLCCHPALLQQSAEEFDDPDSRRGSRYASWLKREGYLDHLGTAADDTKLNAAIEVIAQIVSEDQMNKVVVFSFFKPMLRLLGSRLKKIPRAFITGDLTTVQRQHSLTQFKGPVPVLLSSDAGQYGIDLPHANYLLSYDLPWSAGAYAQRTARIDRVSSIWPHVTIMSLLARRSIEDWQFAMLRQKQKVAEAWLDGLHIDAQGGLTLTLASLRTFLMAA